MSITRRTLLAAASGLAGGVARERRFTLVHDDGRETAFRALAPRRPGLWKVVLFSHGANASNADYDRLWSVWAERGYLVVGPNHVDSGPVELQPKVSRAALWSTRLADAALPLRRRDAFDAWAHGCAATLDWGGVAAAGHSFGAVVAQGLAGARLIAPGEDTSASRAVAQVAACLTLSPPGPRPGFVPEDAWSTVTVPCFLQTGDADVLPGFVDDWRTRLIGFSGRSNRWVIIGRGVDHYFGGQICRLKPGPEALAQSQALNETAEISADFLDAHLRRSSTARHAMETRATLGDDGVATFFRA